MAREIVSVIENKRKNYIQNAGFDFFQRHGPSHVFSGNTFVADRWFAGASGTPTYSRETDSAPAGSEHYLQFTTTASSQGWNDSYTMEDFDIKELQGKEVTFSYLIRRTGALNDGTSIRIFKIDTPNTRTGGTQVLLAQLDIDDVDIPLDTGSVSDWKEFKLTFTVPDDGTAEGLRVNIVTLAAFPDSGATFQVAQPMLNLGNTRAPFQLYAKDLPSELEVCQRYYEKSYDIDIAPGTTGGPSEVGCRQILSRANGQLADSVQWRVKKRVTPSAIPYSIGTGAPLNLRDITIGADINTSLQLVGDSGAIINAGTTNDRVVRYQWTADAEFS